VKKYIVNEVFYTLQGEGFHSGRAAIFCRFSRCNLWTGREEDRAKAICQFCDTDFLAGISYSLSALVELMDELWVGADMDKFVVFTGGEPALQLDQPLVDAMWESGYYVAVESNGTLPLPTVDWVCISPKGGSVLPKHIVADEIKLVYPQEKLMPDQLLDCHELSFKEDCLWLSPMDGPDIEENTQSAIEYVMANPMWRLNTQTHKTVGIR
jgi:7-carboxy-7-deazaguanine synthase